MKTLLLLTFTILSLPVMAETLHISDVNSVELNDRTIVYTDEMTAEDEAALGLRNGVFTVQSTRSVLNIELNDGTVVTATASQTEGSDVVAYDPPLGGGNGGNGTGTKN